MFEASLVNDSARTSRPYTVSVSALLQVLAATVAVTYPLWHIEALPKVRLRSPYRNAIRLVDPQPVVERQQPMSRPLTPQSLTFPSPLRRAPIPDARRTDAVATGPMIDAPVLTDSAGQFVPGPIGPGNNSRDTGPLIAVAPRPSPTQPNPPATRVTGPVRPGGLVKPPQLLREIKPIYPPLAIATRTQGTVRIEAVIARDGTVRDARVVSGHPLLVAAALNAVRQWQYRPTSLNGEPVEVALALEVNFTLSR